MQTLSDEALMALVKDGKEKAFQELYQRYSRGIYSYFFRMLKKDRELSQDFTQELFSKVFKYAASFDEGKSFKTWLYSMANNQCKNEYAKWEVRGKAQMDIQTADFGSSISGADRTAFKAALDEALGQLDEAKRTVFEMRYVQDLSNVEIAEALQISEGTVKSRLFYTLKELNTKLQGYKELLSLLTLIFMVQ